MQDYIRARGCSTCPFFRRDFAVDIRGTTTDHELLTCTAQGGPIIERDPPSCPLRRKSFVVSLDKA